jgi:SAM-dependent methyltransferase
MNRSLGATLIYPLPDRPAKKCEHWALRYQRWPGFCTVCGRWVWFLKIEENLRESCLCQKCGSTNRQRQLAMISAVCAGCGDRGFFPSLPQLAHHGSLAIYNTESSGPVHDQLSISPGYTCSEYFGPEYRSGETVRGVPHQDLQSCSFADESFDLVLSSDVLEHVPDPYQAHREIFRILKKGGLHVFTVPFYHTLFRDVPRSRIDVDGRLVHMQEPWYHGDPVRPNQGILVFRVFSMEMLVHLEEIGFQPRIYQLYQPWFGILGPNAIVFEAEKRIQE